MIFGMARGFCADFLPQIHTDLFSQIDTDKLKEDSFVLQLCFLFFVRFVLLWFDGWSIYHEKEMPPMAQ